MVGYRSCRPPSISCMNRDYSVIDANLARIKEGIRVLEDIVRFVFADKELFEALKILRHSLSGMEVWFQPAHTIGGRFGTDVGGGTNAPGEFTRHSLYSLIRANASRSIEALRVLEEFAKLYSKKNAHLIERARYQMYSVERDLLVRTPHFWLSRFFEEGTVYPLSDSLEDIKDFIDAGAKVIQLRDKSGSKKLIYEKGKEICRYIIKRQKEGKEKIIFLINDHVDIAAQLPVDGVHLGQDDGEIIRARQILGSNKIIGRSTHSLEDARVAVGEGADYIGVGPIFVTPIKNETLPIGIDILKKIVDEIPLPICAIGGITKENVKEVYKTGARNVAAIRGAKELLGKK